MATREQGERLDSWKEIADYLGRDVRTVVRWEKERGLPVRRLPGGKRQSVFALIAELDAWLVQQRESPEDDVPAAAGADNSGANAAVQAGASPRLPRAVWKLLLAGVAVVIALLGWMVSTQKHAPSGTARPLDDAAFVRLGTQARPLQFTRLKIETGVAPYRFAAADLNGDGNLDLVFSSAPGEVLGVLMGTGDGTFLPARLYGGCPQSDSIVIADLNHDGIPDIAVTCFAQNSVLILWGKGDGTFPERTEIPVPGGPRYLAIGDVNRNGWPDLVASSIGDSSLRLLTNHAGSFSTTLIAHFEATAAVTLADWNNSGRPGLLAGVRDHGRSGIALFQGTKEGSFKFSRLLDWNDDAPGLALKIQVVDIDGDGTPDIVAALWHSQVFTSRGILGGGFSSPKPVMPGSESPKWWTFALADLDLDGKPDLLLTNSRESTLDFLKGTGTGTFTPSGSLNVGNSASTCIVADFNNDGLPDILINTFEGATLLKASGEKIAHR